MKKIIASLAFVFMIAVSLSSCMPQSGDQAKTGSSGGILGQYGSFIFMGLIILVFWMFFIRPQQKRAKNQRKFIDDLGKGDKIVTIAGIHGTINKVNEDGTLNIEISPGSYIKIEKSAISMDWTTNLHKAAGTLDKK
jgi:preprotein translocase subunit YajC